MNATTTALKIVDDLGLIQDQIDALTEQAESLKDQLKLLGAGTYAGTMYVTTIKVTPEKKSTSWSAVAKEMSAPALLVAKHTKITYNIMSATTEPLTN
jgi:predicted aconitase